MRKTNLIAGIINLSVGLLSLISALLTDTSLEGLLFAFALSCTTIGIITIYKYAVWNSPKNKEDYIEKLKAENIERNDELKEKVRGKSAQYAYTAGLFVISFSTVLFYALDSLNIVENGTIFVYFLCIYFIFQLVIGSVIFKYLMKKY